VIQGAVEALASGLQICRQIECSCRHPHPGTLAQFGFACNGAAALSGLPFTVTEVIASWSGTAAMFRPGAVTGAAPRMLSTTVAVYRSPEHDAQRGLDAGGLVLARVARYKGRMNIGGSI
jgi:hypothetical protein